MRPVVISALLLLLAGAGGCRKQTEPDRVPAEALEVAVPLEYSVDISVPERLRAREGVQISVHVAASESLTRPNDAVESSRVHVVAVSRDLAWYEHVHPHLDGDAYRAVLTFPTDGEYILHSIVPMRDRPQLVQKRTVVVGHPASKELQRELMISPRESRSGRYTVRLRSDPEPPAAGGWSSLIFQISRDGTPVTNLTPTGTLGHMAILREGGEDFVYAHSTDGEAVSGVRAQTHQPAIPPSVDNTHQRHTGDTGPEVTFHTQFPRPDRYKLWVEFSAGENSIKSDFVVEVGQRVPVATHVP